MRSLWLDPGGRARVERRLERDPQLGQAHQAKRLLEANAKHECLEEKDQDGLCPQDRVAIKVAAVLLSQRPACG